jgi:hypothetical protein
MNLREAEKSLNYFADLLNMRSALLRSAVALEARAGSVVMASQATEDRQQLFTQLQESYKDAQILSILLYKEMGKQAERLFCAPKETAKVLTALKRVREAEEQARPLLDEQERILAQKSELEQESATSRAIRKFREREGSFSSRTPNGDK